MDGIPNRHKEGNAGERGRKAGVEIAEQAEPERRPDDEVKRSCGPSGELEKFKKVADRAAVYRFAAQGESAGLKDKSGPDENVHPGARVTAFAQQGHGSEDEAGEIERGGEPKPGTVGD